MRRPAAVVTALFALALASLVASPIGAPSLADPIGQCTASTGTIVAVDYSHWNGPFVRGCGVHSATGYALLHDADFTTAGDQHDGPAFICRIGNPAFHNGTQYPTPSDDQCIVTPPANAYWSYWLAPRGQNTWTFSRLGAMSEVPKQGEVELWQFGATNVAGTEGVPTVTPDELRAHNTSPSGGGGGPGKSSSATPTSHAPPTRPSTGADASTGPGRSAPTRSARQIAAAHSTTRSGSSLAGERASSSMTTTGGAPSNGSATHPVSSASARAAVGPAGASAPAQSGSTAPRIVDAAAASAHTKRPTSGSAVPVIVGLVIALLLGGGAGLTVLRRRRAETMDS